MTTLMFKYLDKLKCQFKNKKIKQQDKKHACAFQCLLKMIQKNITKFLEI